MDYKLGIDLGTASIGVVAVALQDNEPVSIPWNVVRIFSEPVKKTKEGLVPKKAARRNARQLRRQIERRARRLRRIAHLAPLLGIDQSKIQPDSGQSLTRLRAQSARERIELEDFFRVLMRLAKRRGYAGVVRETEARAVKDGSDRLTAAMVDLAISKRVAFVTLGEYIYYRQQQGLPVRLKADRPDVEPLYALRKEHVEAEFEQIWSVQAEHHAALNRSHLGTPIKNWFRAAIFFQRPLKSPASMVGNCLLEPNLPRAPRAQMAAQRFRIEKTLRDLRWGSGRRAAPLSKAQLDVLRPLLETPASDDGKVTFKTLLKALDEVGLSDMQGRTLNLERSSRDAILGNRTVATWRKLGLLAPWRALSAKHQTSIINLLADLGGPELLEKDDWHQCIRKANAKADDLHPYRQFEPPVIEFINDLRASGHYGRFSAMGFESGRSSYSVKALDKLNDWLVEPWWPDGETNATRRGQIDEDAALRSCYPQHFTDRHKLSERLGKAPQTGNDVVDVALRELRRVINQCIEALGGLPKEIIVEMSREVGVGVARRNEWERRIRQNELQRNKIAEVLRENGLLATNTLILRYLLWEDQDTKFCPYCDDPISFEAAMSGRLTNFEHILPRGLTQVRRKRSELVLSHASCNNRKGDQTPWQAFCHDASRWAAVERAAQRFNDLGSHYYKTDRSKAIAFYRKAKLLLLKDYETEVMSDESIAGFADRQLHQTSWIAKTAALWLREITPLVSFSRGEFTALLRHQWRLDTVIAETRYMEGFPVLDTDGQPVTEEDFNRYRPQWEAHPSARGAPRTDRKLDKRLDHRHHGLDALVIAMTSRSLYMNLARRYKDEGEKCAHGEKVRRDWSITPPLPEIRKLALKMIQNCNLSYKQDRNPGGLLFRQTIYARARKGEPDRLILRTKLPDLVGNTVNETLKNLGTIASDQIRSIVIAAFQQRIASGLSAAAALSTRIPFSGYTKQNSAIADHGGIWRVRCYQRQGRGYLKAENGFTPTKMLHHGKPEAEPKLISEGYAGIVCDYHAMRVELISLYRFHQEPVRWKKKITFFIGDTLHDPDDGKDYVIRQFNSSNGKGGIFMSALIDAREKPVLKNVSGKQILRLKKHT